MGSTWLLWDLCGCYGVCVLLLFTKIALCACYGTDSHENVTFNFHKQIFAHVITWSVGAYIHPTPPQWDNLTTKIRIISFKCCMVTETGDLYSTPPQMQQPIHFHTEISLISFFHAINDNTVCWFIYLIPPPQENLPIFINRLFYSQDLIITGFIVYTLPHPDETIFTSPERIRTISAKICRFVLYPTPHPTTPMWSNL